MSLRRSSLFVSGLMALGLVLSSCAAPDPTAAGAEAFNDPLEDTNRAIFDINQSIDRTVLLPAAKTYRTVIIPPMRQAFRDFMQNLNAPVVFANDLLQGQFGLAANTLGRVLINTSMGMGGMFDFATQFGIPYHGNDLGRPDRDRDVADDRHTAVPRGDVLRSQGRHGPRLRPRRAIRQGKRRQSLAAA